MANLQANHAAGGGRPDSFAYFGPGTGTQPLPIYLALLQRIARRQQSGGLLAARTGPTSTFVGRLVRTQPAIRTSAAGDLDDNATRRGRAAARRASRRTSSSSIRTSTTTYNV